MQHGTVYLLDESYLLPALGDAPLEEVLVHSRRDHVGSGLFARHGI